MKLIWKQAYETGIKNIDDQHKNFVGLVNDLYNIVEHDDDPDKINEVLNKLNQYAVYHFKTEEKLFNKYEYTAVESAMHIEKHGEFNKKIDKLKQDSTLSPAIVAYRLADYLRKWLIDHIMIYDMKYAGFIKNKISNNN